MTYQRIEQGRKRRHARIRARIRGTADTPRLSVYRSNRFLHVQLVDDHTGRTLLFLRSGRDGAKGVEGARLLGGLFAEEARAREIHRVVFDRGGFLYAGQVRAFAVAAREGGLQF